MATPIQIICGAVRGKLIGADRAAKLLINKMMSYQVDGFSFMSVGAWDGRMSFFDFGNDTFPAGFYLKVVDTLVQAGYKVQPQRLPAPKFSGPIDPVVDDFDEDPRYDYQREVYRKLEKYRQMIAQVATGGGKSRIARMAYRRAGLPTLFLTTRGVLLHQMKDSFTSMGESVGQIGDGIIAPNFSGMTVGMVQTIGPAITLQDPVQEFEAFEKNRVAAEQREIEELRTTLSEKGSLSVPMIESECEKLQKHLTGLRKNPAELAKLVIERVTKHNQMRATWLDRLKKFGLVILEEAHEASGDGYYDILGACTYSHYKLALTATPDMRESAEANLRLRACSGPIGIKVTEKTLIDRGILAKPYFKFVSLPGVPTYPEQRKVQGVMKEFQTKLYRTTPWPAAYEIGVSKNPIRNSAIIEEARRAIAHGLTVMVLVHQKTHGKLLSGMFADAGLRVAYIFGEHNQGIRQAAIGALKDRRIDILIGSTILDVGVDIPAVGMVIIASAGKAEVALRQRIGRGLREKKKGPNVALIVDFTDDLNNHLRGHARERRAFIDATPGFAENVVADFDYEALGFLKKAA